MSERACYIRMAGCMGNYRTLVEQDIEQIKLILNGFEGILA